MLPILLFPWRPPTGAVWGPECYPKALLFPGGPTGPCRPERSGVPSVTRKRAVLCDDGLRGPSCPLNRAVHRWERSLSRVASRSLSSAGFI